MAENKNNPLSYKDKSVDHVRRSVEKKIEIAEKEQRHKLLTHRLEYARAGIDAYNRHKIMEAVKAFQSYLRVLEEIKQVREGGLTPACFDAKADLSEMLMISGIYWDLVKLFDRTQSSHKHREFAHYLEKYVAFSKGMPYQALCAESLRKYIAYGSPLHRSDFQNAYKLISVARCFIATSLIDVTKPTTLPALRQFRDQVLKRSSVGRGFVLGYYHIGPRVAAKVDHLPNRIRKMMGLTLDFIAYFCYCLTNLLVKQRADSFRSKDKLTIRKACPKG